MRWPTIISLVLVLAAAAYLVLGPSHEPEQGSSSAERGADQVPAVALVEIRQTDLLQWAQYSGSLEPSAEIEVRARVDGRVEAVHVELADLVNRGQLLVELEDARLVQSEQAARARVRVTRAAQAAAEHELQAAQHRLERGKKLRGRGIIAQEELDDLQAEIGATRADLALAEARVVQSRTDARRATIDAGYTKVHTEWKGGAGGRHVAARHVDEGAWVTAHTPLVTIVDLDPVEVAIFVTEKDHRRLSAGMAVELTTDAFPGRVFPAKVARIAPVFDPSSRQARVELLADNPGFELQPGMFVRARVALQSVTAATVVPESALIRDDAGEFIYVARQSGSTTQVARVDLRTGIRAEAGVEVLEPTDLQGWAVTLGKERLHDGAEVVVPDRPAEARAALRANPQESSP